MSASIEMSELEDFDLFQLKGSMVSCYRNIGPGGKPRKGKTAWKIEIPHKSMGGCKWKYADTAAAAWIEADKWRKKGY